MLGTRKITFIVLRISKKNKCKVKLYMEEISLKMNDILTNMLGCRTLNGIDKFSIFLSNEIIMVRSSL